VAENEAHDRMSGFMKNRAHGNEEYISFEPETSDEKGMVSFRQRAQNSHCQRKGQQNHDQLGERQEEHRRKSRPSPDKKEDTGTKEKDA
jgi:hypothetical protein